MKTRLTLCIILLCIFSVVPLLAAQSAQQQFDDANAAYAKHDYQNAVLLYEKVFAEHGASAALLFNLGNAYAQTGNPGKAVLNYLRAENLGLDDADISRSLQQIRREYHLAPEKGEFSRYLDFLTYAQWGWLLFACLCISFFLLLTEISRKKQSHGVMRITIGAMIVSCVAMVALIYQWRSMNPAVVVSSQAMLRFSPIEDSDIAGELYGGELLYPLRSHGKYVYINDAAGNSGWVASDEIEAVQAL